MLILHCMKQKLWETMKNEPYIGKPLLEQNPFYSLFRFKVFLAGISSFLTMSRKILVLLVIETEELDVPVKWEDLEGCGRTYPHVYGLIKAEAIRNILPYLKQRMGPG